MTLQQEIIQALGAKPAVDANEEIRRSVDFLKAYLKKNSFLKSLVLGISGGQDSTLTGKLCQMAISELREETGDETLQFIAALPAEDTEARKIDRQLEKLKADYEQAMRFKMSAYEKFVDHLLNEDEFKQYQRIYTEKCEAIAAAISKRQEELDAIVQAGSPQGEWIAHFKSFRHVDVMERKILVKIIDRIYVYEGNRIEIIFKYQNEYRAAATYIEQYMERQATQAAPTVKEAV